MPAYTTKPAVRGILSPDGDQSATLGTAASLSDAEIDAAIAEVQAEIDARLAVRYDTPFTDVPALVETITRDIAAYLATLTYRRNVPLPQDDPVALRYARAWALLTAAAKGDIDLMAASGDPVGVASEATVVNNLGYEGTLFDLRDFSLGQTPVRWPGVMPAGPYDEGF